MAKDKLYPSSRSNFMSEIKGRLEDIEKIRNVPDWTEDITDEKIKRFYELLETIIEEVFNGTAAYEKVRL